jgi:hypothetical protein
LIFRDDGRVGDESNIIALGDESFFRQAGVNVIDGSAFQNRDADVFIGRSGKDRFHESALTIASAKFIGSGFNLGEIYTAVSEKIDLHAGFLHGAELVEDQ